MGGRGIYTMFVEGKRWGHVINHDHWGYDRKGTRWKCEQKRNTKRRKTSGVVPDNSIGCLRSPRVVYRRTRMYVPVCKCRTINRGCMGKDHTIKEGKRRIRWGSLIGVKGHYPGILGKL